jgi:transcriptional regulator with XRE-family HTH domain
VTLGQKIRAVRIELRMTQEQLAGPELSKSYISELERGHRTPRLATLKLLARRLKRPVSFFLEGVTEDQEPEAFLMLGLAYLHAQSFDEAAVWLQKALDAVSHEHDELLHARIELALAYVDQRLGHDLRAWRRIERVLPVLARNDDRGTLIRAHISIGRAKLATGETSSAAWTFETALLLLAVPESDPSAASALYYYLGIARERTGQTTEAAQAFRNAVQMAESLADIQSAGAWHVRRAAEAAKGSSFDDAIVYAREAIAVYDILDQKRRLAEIHWHFGDFEARAEHWKEAHRRYLISVALYGAVRQPPAAARALGYFLEVLHDRMPEAARTIGETALALFPDDGGTAAIDEDRAGLLWLRGTIERLLGKSNEARSSLTESLRAFEVLRCAEEVRNIRRELALLAIESNDLTAAREYLAAVHEPVAEYRITPVL